MKIRDALELKSNPGEIISTYFDCDLEAFLFAMHAHEQILERAIPQSDGSPAQIARSREFRRWWNMMQRCYDNRLPNFRYYGAKGVQVCERWHTFGNFFADMGVPPSDEYSIDRIDSTGNYEPENCRWATPDVQYANRLVRPPKGSVCMIKGKWRALVRVKGTAKSKYFADKNEALQWSEKTALALSM